MKKGLNGLRQNKCLLNDTCSMHDKWSYMKEVFEEIFSKTALEEINDKDLDFIKK